jgi:hypothetical protein
MGNMPSSHHFFVPYWLVELLESDDGVNASSSSQGECQGVRRSVVSHSSDGQDELLPLGGTSCTRFSCFSSLFLDASPLPKMSIDLPPAVGLTADCARTAKAMVSMSPVKVSHSHYNS